MWMHHGSPRTSACMQYHAHAHAGTVHGCFKTQAVPDPIASSPHPCPHVLNMRLHPNSQFRSAAKLLRTVESPRRGTHQRGTSVPESLAPRMPTHRPPYCHSLSLVARLSTSTAPELWCQGTHVNTIPHCFVRTSSIPKPSLPPFFLLLVIIIAYNLPLVFNARSLHNTRHRLGFSLFENSLNIAYT